MRFRKGGWSVVQDLKSRITRYMICISLITMITMMVIFVVYQLQTAHETARVNAREIFAQVGQILESNDREKKALSQQYHDEILRRADTVAYILERDPSIRTDPEALRDVAATVGVDEIHLIDGDGVIFCSTVPESFGLSFDSGEQIAFFKPMLTDKSLRMVQEITPNTAQGAQLQYTCVWSRDGSIIVQVGMVPENVEKLTEQNELSYLFSLLRTEPGVRLYIVDPATEIIEAATQTSDTGRTLSDVGINPKTVRTIQDGFYTDIDGESHFCIFSILGGRQIGYALSYQRLHGSVSNASMILSFSMALGAILLVLAVTGYMDIFVINPVDTTNECLREIAEGNLDKKVDIRSSLEFSELSNHINAMVNSLLASTQKMSYVLDRAEINIGVYEYSPGMARVRFTERVPRILGIEGQEHHRSWMNREDFQQCVEALKARPFEEEEGVYRRETADGARYIKLEEMRDDSGIMGILMDVTEAVNRRLAIESERDIDPLTGILNRRGMDNTLSRLYEEKADIGHCAVVMIDADGLKQVNDTYGHDSGDLYIRGIAQALTHFGEEACARFAVSRNGGDEFVMFLYGYSDREALMDSIRALHARQDAGRVALANGLRVPLRYSVGYALSTGEGDYYGDLFKAADASMYENKRQRKQLRLS